MNVTFRFIPNCYIWEIIRNFLRNVKRPNG